MNRALYRELWALRFEKMLKLEEQSVAGYQALLDESRAEHKNHAICQHLERLVSDEKKHAKLVRELIEILNSQPD